MRFGEIGRRACGRPAVVVGAAVLAFACGEDAGTAPGLESFGAIEIRLETPHDDDRALMLSLTGPLRDVRAADGFTAFTTVLDSRTALVLVAQDGRSIPSGGVAAAYITLERADTRYVVELVEVAARDHAIRASLEDYSLEVVAPE